MGRKKTINWNLPPRMLAREKPGGIYYYYCTRGANRKEIPLGKDFSRAMILYKEYYFPEGGGICPVPNGYGKVLHKQIFKNSKPRGIPFTLTIDDIDALLARSEYRCELTNIPFDMSPKGYRIRPWIPSIDRIDSTLGYDFANCRVVVAAVNIALNQFGDEMLIYIAERLKSSKRK